MGLCLIAAGWLSLELWIAVLQVAFGLGMVIFVHELGHFAVAKLCGVKCEKFYLGFDIAGLKLCKFRWGETEYGIGILPLGGYVKMLGQEDNPARLREEIERAKLKQHAEAERPGGEKSGDRPEQDAGEAASGKKEKGDQIDVKAAEAALYDPRSYLAQSVPRRMGIISAGVIMNLVFGFVAAVIAFQMGVLRLECRVGSLIAGDPAWQANLKVGDRIVSIAERNTEKFRDMQEAVTLCDNPQQGIPVVVMRPGVEQPLLFPMTPSDKGLLLRIGIGNPRKTSLVKKGLVTIPGSPAAEAKPAFGHGDKIVKIDDAPMENDADVRRYLAAHPEKPLAITVERETGGDGKEGVVETLTIKVRRNKMRRLGLVMEMGEISVVQAKPPAALAGVVAESPATAAGIKPGDKICSIDGQPPFDPMTLPDELRQRAGETVALTVEREGEKEPLDFEVTLRAVDDYDLSGRDSPVTVPALGIGYKVLNRVHSVMDGFPAQAAGLKPGDVILEATVLPPDDKMLDDLGYEQSETTLEFSEDHRNWPLLSAILQEYSPGTRVRLTWVGENEKVFEKTLELKDDPNWFNPARGLIFQPDYFRQQGSTFFDSVRLGADETLHSTLLVYRFIQKLTTGQISGKALGGPIAIFTVAISAAEQGAPELLIFLTLLSANLAVINFLPIPLLDGGHMVLLAWEGIRGKPASERVQMVLTYIGLAFILALMTWVLSLDFGLIPRF